MIVISSYLKVGQKFVFSPSQFALLCESNIYFFLLNLCIPVLDGDNSEGWPEEHLNHFNGPDSANVVFVC